MDILKIIYDFFSKTDHATKITKLKSKASEREKLAEQLQTESELKERIKTANKKIKKYKGF